VLPPNREIDPWVAKMLSLDISNRRHVLKRFKPSPMPPFLYKYFSANHPYSRQNLRDVIVRSVLRMNPPSEFNDPFEMRAHFVMTATEDEKLARFESLAREQAPHLGWRALQARIRALMAASEETFTPVWQQSLNSIREEAGIYCFAGSGKSTLMWSHYASDHKGACLQFERVQDIAVLSHAVRVRYAPDLPIVNWVTDFQKGIGDMLFAKHPCWEYEQESRILIYGQAGRYLAFAPQALTKIVLGCRADPAYVEAVQGWVEERTALGHPPIDVYLARQHPQKYRLVIKH
jgi:hypothetical protein